MLTREREKVISMAARSPVYIYMFFFFIHVVIQEAQVTRLSASIFHVANTPSEI